MRAESNTIPEFLVRSFFCQVLNVPKDLRADVARFGHSAVKFEGSLYIYGGFDGVMLNDILK